MRLMRLTTKKRSHKVAAIAVALSAFGIAVAGNLATAAPAAAASGPSTMARTVADTAGHFSLAYYGGHGYGRGFRTYRPRYRFRSYRPRFRGYRPRSYGRGYGNRYRPYYRPAPRFNRRWNRRYYR
jgi:hypothetical protein